MTTLRWRTWGYILREKNQFMHKYVHLPAGLVLNGKYINLSLHPIVLHASTANSYFVYGVIFVVILILVILVVYWLSPSGDGNSCGVL